MYTHDKRLLKIQNITWKNNSIIFKDPVNRKIGKNGSDTFGVLRFVCFCFYAHHAYMNCAISVWRVII